MKQQQIIILFFSLMLELFFGYLMHLVPDLFVAQDPQADALRHHTYCSEGQTQETDDKNLLCFRA